MIALYFSGTGNSKHIVELFGRNMGVRCFSIEEDINFSQLIASNNTVVFCYPIYGSRVPRIMREFVKKYMEYLKGKKVIIFCTQWIFSGDGARAFVDIFPKKSVEVIYAEHFFMPNNICNFFLSPPTSEKKIPKYIKK
ncbi:MAG: flavodoxin domain-containing protein, partial [Chitinispirillales bacterium]|nr:flavodoxin domain-containing protein [Chitinispirillales bacterium]